jgi:argininosuccinate lyase
MLSQAFAPSTLIIADFRTCAGLHHDTTNVTPTTQFATFRRAEGLHFKASHRRIGWLLRMAEQEKTALFKAMPKGCQGAGWNWHRRSVERIHLQARKRVPCCAGREDNELCC